MGLNTIKQHGSPEMYVGDGFGLTQMEKVIGLARAHSIWPLPFATSCGGI